MTDLTNLINQNFDKIFLETSDKNYSYRDLFNRTTELDELFRAQLPSCLLVLEVENDFDSFAKVLNCLIYKRAFLMLSKFHFNSAPFKELLKSELKSVLVFISSSNVVVTENRTAGGHPLVEKNLQSGASLFVVRTSGSSGNKPKFVLHDANLFIKKYILIGSHFNKTFSFSPLESIAGIETLLETLVNTATLVSPQGSFNPQIVVDLLKSKKVDYFQTTPSFLNLLVLTGKIKNLADTVLKKIAYGSEPITKMLVDKVQKELPHVELVHTYGMTEIGIQNTTTSQADASKFKLNKNFNDYSVVDGLLYVSSLTPLVGYLNLNSVVNRNSFFTGDRVVADENNFLKVLGRDSDLINLAGRKFYPSEVEEVLLQHQDILDVVVYAESHPLLGINVVAKAQIDPLINRDDLMVSLKPFLETHLPSYLRPQKFIFTHEALTNDRFKKVRAK